MKQTQTVFAILLFFTTPQFIFSQQICANDALNAISPAVDNDLEQPCGCSCYCNTDGICSPEGTGSCTEGGTNTTIVYVNEDVDINLSANTDYEITVSTISCGADASCSTQTGTPSSYLESQDNIVIDTPEGDYDHLSTIGSWSSNFGNQVNLSFCYSTGGSAATINIELTANRKDECLDITVTPSPATFPVPACILLASELSAFEVNQLNNGEILLDWSVPFNHGIKKFEVQRKVEAEAFETIANIEVNDQLDQDFQFIDEDPGLGMNYYRIKLVDLEERMFFSLLRSIKNFSSSNFMISPNPFRDYLKISLKEELNKPLAFSLYNIFGQKLKDLIVPSGTIATEFLMDDLDSGYYVLNLHSPSNGDYSAIF